MTNLVTASLHQKSYIVIGLPSGQRGHGFSIHCFFLFRVKAGGMAFNLTAQERLITLQAVPWQSGGRFLKKSVYLMKNILPMLRTLIFVNGLLPLVFALPIVTNPLFFIRRRAPWENLTPTEPI